MKEEDIKDKLKTERAENQKLKVHKDFGFLLKINPIFISRRTAKYILQEGVDQPVSSFKENPFEAFVSYIKYDYDGKAIEKVSSTKISSDKGELLQEEVLSMKMKEKAWFNVCNQPIHDCEVKIEEIEHGSITEDTDEFQVQKEDEEVPKARTGFHYEVTLERIEFKNSDKIEIKRKINEQNREKGKKLFQEGKYYEASKVYKFIIHISENLPRNNPYTAQDKGQLESMNINARLNYIRCYFKIKEDWNIRDLTDFAKQTIELLLKRKPNDHTTHFYHAKWLLRERILDDALQAARRSNSLKRNEATEDLIKEILEEKKNKGKIKVAVRL